MVSQNFTKRKFHFDLLSQKLASYTCYFNAKELTRILDHLIGRTTDINLQNSTHFVQLVRNIELHDKDLLVSFDLKCLFAKVHIDDTLKYYVQDIIFLILYPIVSY